jgi:proline-rich protein PRCC
MYCIIKASDQRRIIVNDASRDERVTRRVWLEMKSHHIHCSLTFPIMLGLDYGSDSDGDDTRSAPSTAKAPVKKAKKIMIALPAPMGSADSPEDEQPPAKKPRLGGNGAGAGMSSLLSMLPAPKQSASSKTTPAPRVLGGGQGKALSFAAPGPAATVPLVDDHDDEEVTSAPSTSNLFRPTSLAKGRSNVNLDSVSASAPVITPTPAVDFFSLNTAHTPRSNPPSNASKNSAPSVLSTSVPKATPALSLPSSAPEVTDFIPPEPTPTDEYPGYYRLPSGEWAAHDPSYYKTFYDRWKRDYDAHVRALERGARGFEAYDADTAEVVDGAAERERAKVEVKEREETKALTTGGEEGEEKAKPRMNVQVHVSAITSTQGC